MKLSRKCALPVRAIAALMAGAFLQACGAGRDVPEQTGQAASAVEATCADVPSEWIGVDDGCDCPADGDTSCDPDCAESNDGSEYCGCDYCHPEYPPEDDPGGGSSTPPGEPGPLCSEVPSEWKGANDGCDCPADGDTSCDTDCSEYNAGGTYCGCDFCHPEEPPEDFPASSGEHGPFEDPFTPPGSGDESACPTAAAHVTLAGGGDYVTDASYEAAGCWRGHVVDLNDYHPNYDAGTWIGSGGPAPTTPSACAASKLVIQAWRRASGTPQFLGEIRRGGVWTTDPWGASYCRPPLVKLEDEISDYQPEQDYRIAIRAHDAELERRPILFGTIQASAPETPLSQVEDLKSAVQMLDEFLTVPASNPNVQAFLSFRNSAGGANFCRAQEVSLTLLEVVNPALLKLGVPSSTINAHLASDRAIHDAICTLNNPVDWSLLRSRIAAGTVRDQALLSALANALGSSTEQAAKAMSDLAKYTLAALVTKCDAQADALLDFVSQGIKPAGIAGGRLLLGNCGTDPGQVGGQLGIGALPQTVGQQIEACMNEMLATNQTCSDPRAQGSPEAEPEPPPTASCDAECEAAKQRHQEKIDRIKHETVGSFLDEKKLEGFVHFFENEEAALEGKLGIDGGKFVTDLGKDLSPNPHVPEEQLTKVGKKVNFIAKAVGLIKDVIDLATDYGTLETARERTRFWREQLNRQQQNTNELCRQLGSAAFPQCNRRCPEFDFGDFSGYYATHDPRSGVPRQLNELDRVNHCMCTYLGERITGSACETDQDREKQECLRNPDGPDGAPKPHCQKHMLPMDLDMDLVRTRHCEKMYPNCDGDFMNPDSVCGCVDVPEGAIGDPVIFCPHINVTDCGPEGTLDLASCRCQFRGTGAPGYGTQGPGCLLDDFNFGANVRPMLTTRPSALTTDLVRTASGQVPVIRTEPGFEPFATGALRIADFENRLSNRINLDIDFPAELAASTSGRTMVNVSVFGNGSTPSMIDKPIGTISHSVLQAGALNRVSLDLPSAVQQRLAAAEIADEDVHFIFVNETAPNLPITPGLARLDLGGLPRTAAERSPLCPRPGPDPLPFTNPVVYTPLTDPIFLAVPVGNTAVRWPFEDLILE